MPLPCPHSHAPNTMYPSTIQQSAGQVKLCMYCKVLYYHSGKCIQSISFVELCLQLLYLTQCIIFCYHLFYRYAQPNHAPTIKWMIRKWFYLWICCNKWGPMSWFARTAGTKVQQPRIDPMLQCVVMNLEWSFTIVRWLFGHLKSTSKYKVRRCERYKITFSQCNISGT